MAQGAKPKPIPRLEKRVFGVQAEEAHELPLVSDILAVLTSEGSVNG